tara:strand:+ start:503 stop:1348 length:846 start_codon:yes stop_codon:yes gene_type:complete
METLKDKTAVVTGAASGIGLAMVRRFARAGAKLVISDIDDTKLKRALDEVTGLGASAMAMTVDVADESQNRALFESAIEKFGQVNVVCLNAGVQGSIGRSWSLSKDDYEWALGIVLGGVIHGVRTFVPHLVDHGDGHVVITASVSGHVSSPFNAPYTIAKHGAVTLAETLFHELQMERSTVGVTCLCPGSVKTNIANAAAALPPGSAGSTKGKLGNQILEMSQQVVEDGLDPAVVGEQVHDAILDGRFWLFTDESWDGPIAARATEIAGRAQPRFRAPNFE